MCHFSSSVPPVILSLSRLSGSHISHPGSNERVGGGERVLRFKRKSFWVDSGSGEAPQSLLTCCFNRIYIVDGFKQSLSIESPFLSISVTLSLQTRQPFSPAGLALSLYH